MSELSTKLDNWIDDNTVDGDFIAHPDFVYDKLLELESQLNKADERIAELEQAINGKLYDFTPRHTVIQELLDLASPLNHK